MCPGLCQKQRDQQGKGGDCLPCETPHGVLHTVLESLSQEKPGSAVAGPENIHKNSQRDGTSLFQRQAETAGIFQLEEEKTLGRPCCGLIVFKRGLQRRGSVTFYSK